MRATKAGSGLIAGQIQFIGIDGQQRRALIQMEEMAVFVMHPSQIAFGKQADNTFVTFLQTFAVVFDGGLQINHHIGLRVLRQNALLHIGKKLLLVIIQNDRRKNTVFSGKNQPQPFRLARIGLQ